MEGEDVALTYCLISDSRCLFAERNFQMSVWLCGKKKNNKKAACAQREKQRAGSFCPIIFQLFATSVSLASAK